MHIVSVIKRKDTKNMSCSPRQPIRLLKVTRKRPFLISSSFGGLENKKIHNMPILCQTTRRAHRAELIGLFMRFSESSVLALFSVKVLTF